MKGSWGNDRMNAQRWELERGGSKGGFRVGAGGALPGFASSREITLVPLERPSWKSVCVHLSLWPHSASVDVRGTGDKEAPRLCD